MEYCNESLKRLNETALPMEDYVQYVLGAAMAILIIVTIVGNVMTVAAFIIDKQLRTVYNTFIFNLAITDLLIGMVSMPFHAAYTVGEFHWYLGRIFCKVWFVADFTLCFESVLTILLLSYDRFLLIRYGHRYEIKVTMKSAVVKIVITWIVAFLCWGPFIIGWDIWKGCTIIEEYVCDVEFLYHYEYALATAIIEFFMPFKGLLIINAMLYYKLRRFLIKNKTAAEEIEGLTTTDTLETLTEGEEVSATANAEENSGVAMRQRKTDSASEDQSPKLTESTLNEEHLEEQATKQSYENANEHEHEERKRRIEDEQLNEDEKNLVTSEAESPEEDKLRLEEEESLESLSATRESTREQTQMDDTIITRGTEETDTENMMTDDQSLEAAKEHKEAESSDILESVLGVMEKHGSCLFSSASEENIIESTENAGNATGEAAKREKDPDAPRPHLITSTLKRRFSGYANRIFGGGQSADGVCLEKIKDAKEATEQENDTERNYKEVDIDLAILQRKKAESPKRKESTQSNVTTRIRRNTKAARFLAILVVVFFICWAPYTIATIITVFCQENEDECVGRIVYEALTWLLWFKSAINPFLYAYNSSRYRHNFARFLPCFCSKGKKRTKKKKLSE